MAELIATVPGGLGRYRPYLRYFLLDEGRFTEADLAPLRNLAAALFRLENSRTPGEVQRVLGALIDWLKAPERGHLRRVFTVWLKRVFLPGRAPGVVFDGLQDLHEVEAMLAERVKEWTEEWKRQGLQEGIQQGLQQGMQQGVQQGLQQGEAAVVLRLLECRFGRAYLLVGGGHYVWEEAIESLVNPRQSEMKQMIEPHFAPAHTHPFEALLNQPFTGTFH